MLLAGDGQEVIVLERDPARPPSDPAEAWERWQLPAPPQPPCRQLADVEARTA